MAGPQEVQGYVDQLLSERRTVIAPSSATPPGVDWKTYVDTIVSDERRAVSQANEEREKAAVVLKDALIETIRTGDENLRQHILHQIEGTRQQIESLNAIFTERDKAIEVAHQAAKEATSKAENAVNQRLHDGNDYRSQLREQFLNATPRETFETFKVEQLKTLSKMLPRETFDAVVESWTAWRNRFVTDDRDWVDTHMRETSLWRDAHVEEMNKRLGSMTPRETFNRTLDEWTTWRAVVNDNLSRQAGKTAAYAGLTVFFVVAVNVLLYVLGH